MILKMSTVTSLYILLTVLIWNKYRSSTLRPADQLLIGVIYGLCSVLSTHYGIDYGDMMLNVRDIGPLAAGLFFHPVSGVIAGLIGGIERYIVGTYFGVGSYTRIACSLSTCLAGFLSVLYNKVIFRGKKPSPIYAFFMGAVMEVFHMYVVLITHRADMKMAFYVVRICSVPMIIFTGLGLALSSLVLMKLSGEWRTPSRQLKGERVPVSRRFQFWLFAVTFTVFLLNFAFSFAMQTQSAFQNAQTSLKKNSEALKTIYRRALNDIDQETKGTDREELALARTFATMYINSENRFDLYNSSGKVIVGTHIGEVLTDDEMALIQSKLDKKSFILTLSGTEYLCRSDELENDLTLLTMLPTEEVYASRDAQAYENTFANILLFTVIYILISYLVQQIIVNNLNMINRSLDRITNGNLNEVVEVRDSTEFASLSDDINHTVDALKGYIEAAEKRIEQELIFAHTIQDAALPKNFTFPRSEFELYASMDPAKEVGGDFYDFFFVDMDRIALVIADVSGKGIPASLFMMRAKTAIRSLAESGSSPAEIFYKANNSLCEGNDAEMFVTAWIGIIDLNTGKMTCANAGHEYPMLMRAGGDYNLYKDRHTMPLATIENIRAKEYVITLEPGDRLFVYTDGIPEAINEQTEDYGTDRLVQKLNTLKDVSTVETLLSVRQDISIFAGNAEQFDDITMLCFFYHGNDSEE